MSELNGYDGNTSKTVLKELAEYVEYEEKMLTPEQKSAREKDKKTMGFRVPKYKIDEWKAYAHVKGMEIGGLCRKALDEYIELHKLEDDEIEEYNIRKALIRNQRGNY